MVEIKLGQRSVDMPYMLQFFEVSERRFDRLVDADMRAELNNGVMTVHSPTSMRHDDVENFVRTLMNCYAETENLGRAFGPNCLFRPGKRLRFAPDIFFLRRQRIPIPLPRVFEGTPDVALEVLSPGNRAYDLEKKDTSR